MIYARFVNTVPTAKQRAVEYIIGSMPEGAEIVIKEKTRTGEQNAKLHAMLSDIAMQLKHHGEVLSIDDWKDLLVPAWYKATGRAPKIRPNLDGDGFAMMYRSTAKMGKRDLSELIEFVDAYGSMNGVRWSRAE